MKRSLIFITCILAGTVIISYAGRIADPPATWQQQLESLKANSVKTGAGDNDALKLVGYSHKGVIKSEDEKFRILDAMFSEESPILIPLGRVDVPVDTVRCGNTCVVERVGKYEYDIITVGRLGAIADSLGVINPIPQAKSEIASLMAVGFDLIELQWEFKGRRYTNLGLASNDHGGMVYDTVGSAHVTTTTVSKLQIMNTR